MNQQTDEWMDKVISSSIHGWFQKEPLGLKITADTNQF